MVETVIKTYDDAFRFINGQHRQVEGMGIERVRYALDYLGHPEKNMPYIVHITGTNGKGSTTAMLRSILMQHGLMVGSFTSPHIEKMNDRITINSQPISDVDLIQLTNQLVEINDYMKDSPYDKLTYFELYLIMMILYFSNQSLDVALIEVGIGGLHDTTNVLDGEIAIITSIGLDHGNELGSTIASVAYEKAGIIKPHAKVVLANLPIEAMNLIDDALLRTQAIVYQYRTNFNTRILDRQAESYTQIEYVEGTEPVEAYQLALLGDHQVSNAALAIKASKLVLADLNRNYLPETANIALKQTKWAGRMEKMTDHPLIYIDGAHNDAGLHALKQMLELYFNDKNIHVLYAGLDTKNQEEQLRILASMTTDSVTLTEFNHKHAMKEADWLAIDTAAQFEITPDWLAYMENYLKDDIHQDDLLIVTGSLYFISEVRKFLLN